MVLDYNIYCGRNKHIKNAEEPHCEKCDYLDRCIFILPYDEEFDKLQRLQNDYYRLKNEAIQYKNVNLRFLDSEDEQNEYREKVTNKIKITSPVICADRNFFFLIYISGIPETHPIIEPATYIIVYSSGDEDGYKVINSTLNPETFTGTENDDYGLLRLTIRNRSFESNPDNIIELLFKNLENDCILDNEQIKEGLLADILAEFMTKNYKQRRLSCRKAVRNCEKQIKEYDEILIETSEKIYDMEKKLRKQGIKQVKEEAKRKEEEKKKQTPKRKVIRKKRMVRR